MMSYRWIVNSPALLSAWSSVILHRCHLAGDAVDSDVAAAELGSTDTNFSSLLLLEVV